MFFEAATGNETVNTCLKKLSTAKIPADQGPFGFLVEVIKIYS
jgi:hypothetical protein